MNSSSMFRQLHYTSCEKGLSGHSGFQFCSLSPGIPQETISEVERLTVYEAPRYTRSDATTQDHDAYPTNLIYTHSERNSSIIVARVVFSGIDFSNRSGNYFAHTIIADVPNDSRLASLLPIELWDAPFWQSSQQPATELPLLVCAPAPGPISREEISAFLDADPGRVDLLSYLVAAADESMYGGQQVLLIDTDSSKVACWIGAVCYLLGPTANVLTFTTYTNDPRRCRTHVVGMVTDAGPIRAELAARFEVFEPERQLVPRTMARTSGAMLARIGVVQVQAVWDLAGELGVSVGASLSASLPVLAVAALLLGHRLEAEEFGAALDWLVSPGNTVTGQQIRVAVCAAIRDQPVELLPRSRQEDLVRLAQDTDTASATAVSEHSLADDVECAIVSGVLARFDQNQRLAEPNRLLTERGKAAAVDGWVRRLPQLDAEQAANALSWASGAAVPLPDNAIREAGGVFVAAVLDDTLPRQLPEVAKNWPALRAGIVDSIAALPVPSQASAFTKGLTQILRAADFVDHPALGEEWLIRAAARHLVSPNYAFRQIVYLRRSLKRIPSVDDRLVGLLWPERNWTWSEALSTITWITDEEFTSELVVRQFSTMLRDIPKPEDSHMRQWMVLVERVSAMSRHVLTASDLSVVLSLAPAVAIIRDAKLYQADTVVDAIIAMYKGATFYETRRFLELQLPPWLLRDPRIQITLSNCADALFDEFAQYLSGQLMRTPHNVSLAAKAFVVMRQLGRLNEPRYGILDQQVLAPVLPKWRRKERSDIAFRAETLVKHEGRAFKLWCAMSNDSLRFFRRRG
jgi:hypothetical protein